MIGAEIHTAQCGPVVVWVVLICRAEGGMGIAAHGVDSDERGARWDAQRWLYTETWRLQNEAEALFLWTSSGDDPARLAQRRQFFVPAIGPIRVITTRPTNFEEIRVWCEDVRATAC